MAYDTLRRAADVENADAAANAIANAHSVAAAHDGAAVVVHVSGTATAVASTGATTPDKTNGDKSTLVYVTTHG